MAVGGRKLKASNFDDKKVSNDDLKVRICILCFQTLFSKIGPLLKCVFDRNEFGQCFGSATIVYEDPSDAAKAIKEYHGASLDERLLSVQYDTSHLVKKLPKTITIERPNKAKTLSLGGRRK